MSAEISKFKKSHSVELENEADVLYQRINGKWYAFSIVNDEVFMGAVPEECIADVSKPHESK